MLGLPEQVGGAHLHVGGVVGDDQRLGRAGEQVDADAAEQLPLGFGDKGVAGADQHIDRRDRLGAEAHRGDRLDAAQQIDLVRAAERHRGDRGGGRHAVQRRRAGGDPLHARDLRGQHRHVGRGDHRIPPARHVAADAVDRDVLVTQADAGKRFDLDIAQRVLLRLGEAADLRLGEFDVGDHLVGQAVHQRLDFVRTQAERGGFPFVELRRQFAHRRVAARGDILQDGLDRLADLAVGLGLLGLGRALLQYPDHGSFLRVVQAR